MTQSDPLLMQAISLKSRWLQTRHAVLTQNVANADTPNYRPNDLQEASFARILEGKTLPKPEISMATTSNRHLVANVSPARIDGQREVDGFESSPSGNAVVLEEQAFLLAETRSQYQLATAIYGKFVGLWRTAIGAPGG